MKKFNTTNNKQKKLLIPWTVNRGVKINKKTHNLMIALFNYPQNSKKIGEYVKSNVHWNPSLDTLKGQRDRNERLKTWEKTRERL